MEEHNSTQCQYPEKNVLLCNGDTCIQATIARYDKDRDQRDVIDLLDKNQLKLSQITSEFLDPYFNHEIKSFEQTLPMGLAVSVNLANSTYVLRNTEKVWGFISYMMHIQTKPSPLITGNIVFLCVDPAYQIAGSEQLLNGAFQEMSDKKATIISIMMHEKDTVQRSVIERLGFQNFNQQVKTNQQRMIAQLNDPIKKQEAIKNLESQCFYMKMLEENVTEEMKNPTPIESSLLNITKENYEQEVLNETKPVIIDVYTNWCGPCRHFAPIFEKVSAAHASYKFVRFNCVEEEQELAKELGIEAFPTILFIKNKKVVGKETGFMSQEVLQQKLAEYFN